MKTRSTVNLGENLKPECCRICLNPNNNMICIFNGKFLENIQYCTGIRIKKENRLPHQICKSCQSSLKQALKFKKMCIFTEEICRNLLKNKIKDEPSELKESVKKDYDNETCDNFGDQVEQNKKQTKDQLTDNFNDECDSSFSDGNVTEDYLNGDPVKEDHFNGSSFNDVKKTFDDGQDFPDIKKEECDYKIDKDVEIENVNFEISNMKEISQTDSKLSAHKEKKVGKKRGPYTKTPKTSSSEGTRPRRMKKFKFIKLFCESCQLKFSSREEAQQHRATVHKETWSFMCEVCGKLFAHRGSHYTHLRTHRPPTHACPHCDYCSNNKYDLAKHLLIHAGIKKWQCARCPNSYHTVSNLREHERSVHERVRRHACGACGKAFSDRTHLRRHQDSHNRVKRFECDVCHTAFSRRCHWKKHLLKQHNIVIPAQRPGRRAGRTVEELSKTSELLSAMANSVKPD